MKDERTEEQKYHEWVSAITFCHREEVGFVLLDGNSFLLVGHSMIYQQPI